MIATGNAALEVGDLRVTFDNPPRGVTAVDGVSFKIAPGEIFGLVGESGCGKSVTCRSLIRLFGGAKPSSIEGNITFGGRDLTKLADDDFVRIRGSEIAMIFQDPMTALNPDHAHRQADRGGLQRHHGLTRAAGAARERSSMLTSLASRRRSGG